MIKKVKKAFTIVELVIVIAVVAILASVLIPTFSNIIREASVSADTQQVASMNIQLASSLEKIDSEAKLEKHIDTVYGEGYYEKLAPTSAKYGYHYWYDVAENKIVLATASELSQTAPAGQDASMLNGLGTSTFARNGASTFEGTAFRHAFMTGFYLLDRTGSDVADALSKITASMVSADYKQAIAKILNAESNEHDSAIANKIKEVIATTTIVTEQGTFRFNRETVDKVLFMDGIATVHDELYVYNEQTKEIESGFSSTARPFANVTEVTLPASVIKVETNAMFFENGNVVVYLTEGKISTEIFDKLSTNATIKDANGIECEIGNGYTNPVIDFAVELTQGGEDVVFDSQANALYVVYGSTTVIKLSVKDFVTSGEGEPSNSDVEYSFGSSFIVYNQESGELSFNNSAVPESYTTTITITALGGENCAKEITVKVIRPESVEFKVMSKDDPTNNQVNVSTNDSSVNLVVGSLSLEGAKVYGFNTFVDSPKFYGGVDLLGVPETLREKVAKVQYIGDGDLFTVGAYVESLNPNNFALSGYILTLKDVDYTGKVQNIIVRVGDGLLEKEIAVSVTDYRYVSSFDIALADSETSSNKVKFIDENLYIAYDKGTVGFKFDNFTLNNGDAFKGTADISYEIVDNEYITAQNGVITIADNIPLDKCSATFRVSVLNGENYNPIIKEIIVKVVRPESVQFSIDGNNVSGSSFELSFEGDSEKEYSITINSIGYNFEDKVVCNVADAISFVGNGDLFRVLNNGNNSFIDLVSFDEYAGKTQDLVVKFLDQEIATVELSVKDCTLVTSFDLALNETSDKIKKIGSDVYVAFDKGTVSLKAENFASGKNGVAVKNTDVTFASADQTVATVDGDGNVTILRKPSEKCTVKIIATAVAGGATQEITLHVISIIQGTVKINGQEFAFTNVPQELSISWESFNDKFNISDLAVSYNENGYVSCDYEVYYDTTGGIFEIVDNKIVPKQSGNQLLNISVKKGDVTYLTLGVTIEIIDNTTAPFSVKFEKEYLYRVGNQNTIKLGSLFNKDKDFADATLAIYDLMQTSGEGVRELIATTGNGFTATYETGLTANWANQTIKFAGTGIAIIEIVANSKATTLVVEVVDAKNVTKGSEFTAETNLVLLDNIAFTETQRNYFFTGRIIYGNGFAIDATKTLAPGTEGSGQHGIIRVKGGTIVDNIIINGPVFPEVQYSDKPYFIETLRLEGDAEILNSYITGGRSAVKAAEGDMRIENTVIEGGTYSNLELVGGKKLTLKDVTTVQSRKATTVGTSKQIIGAGIVVEQDVKTEIVLEGEFKQYNFVKEEDKEFLPTEAQSIYSNFFSGRSYENFRHYVDETEYFSIGLLFISGVSAKLTDNRPESLKASEPYAYTDVNVSVMFVSYSAQLYTLTNKGETVTAERLAFDSSKFVQKQSLTKPVYLYNPGLPTEEDTSLTSSYAFYENGIVQVRLNGKDDYVFDAKAGLSLIKYGEDFASVAKVLLDGVEVGSNITFSDKGEHVITYVITDNKCYGYNGSEVSGQVCEYSLSVKVGLTSIPNAVISVDTSKISVMWDSNHGTSCDPNYYYCVAILEGITITDGQNVISCAGMTTMPAGMSVAIDSNNHGHQGTPHTWKTFKTLDNKLYFSSDGVCDNKTATDVIIIQVAYTGKSGNTVYTNVTVSFSGSEKDSKNFTTVKNTTGWLHDFVTLG